MSLSTKPEKGKSPDDKKEVGQCRDKEDQQ